MSLTTPPYSRTPQGQNRGCFQLAIAGILAALLGVLAFELVHLVTSAQYASQIALATDREWLMLRSVYHAQEMHQHKSSDGVVEPSRIRLLADLDRLGLKREQLYYGVSASTGQGHLIGADAPQPLMTFGAGRLNDIMRDWMDRLLAFTSTVYPPTQVCNIRSTPHQTAHSTCPTTHTPRGILHTTRCTPAPQGTHRTPQTATRHTPCAAQRTAHRTQHAAHATQGSRREENSAGVVFRRGNSVFLIGAEFPPQFSSVGAEHSNKPPAAPRKHIRRSSIL